MGDSAPEFENEVGAVSHALDQGIKPCKLLLRCMRMVEQRGSRCLYIKNCGNISREEIFIISKVLRVTRATLRRRD